MNCCERCKNFQPKVDQEKLDKAWEEYKRCRDERDKLYAEADKLAGGGKICAGVAGRYTASDKLYAEGKLVFINAVLSVHGDVMIDWSWNNGNLVAEVEGVKYK